MLEYKRGRYILGAPLQVKDFIRGIKPALILKEGLGYKKTPSIQRRSLTPHSKSFFGAPTKVRCAKDLSCGGFINLPGIFLALPHKMGRALLLRPKAGWDGRGGKVAIFGFLGGG